MVAGRSDPTVTDVSHPKCDAPGESKGEVRLSSGWPFPIYGRSSATSAVAFPPPRSLPRR